MFSHKARYSACEGANPCIRTIVHREHDHGRTWQPRPEECRDGEAIEPGHSRIKHDDIRSQSRCHRERRLTILRFAKYRHVWLQAEPCAQTPKDGRIVIHEQQPDHDTSDTVVAQISDCRIPLQSCWI